MLLKTAQNLWKGARAEWGKTENTTHTSDSQKWLNRIHQNIYAFSAAKSHAQLVELRNAVFDTNSTTRSFTQFRESARTILDKYNELWLETEYEAVKRSTIMARQWLDIKRDKDIYPLLKYVTAGDERVRMSHRALEGKIFPVDSPFWEKYYPPNGWLCRCTVKKLMQGEESDLDASLKIADESTPDYWKKNVGESDIFDLKESPYFDNYPKSALQAVKDYAMQPASRIANRADLPELTAEKIDKLTAQSFYDSLSTDYDGLTISKKNTQAMKNKYLKLFDTTINEPDEVWAVSDQKHYIKYHKGNALVIITNKEGVAVGMDAVDYNTIENYRKGILNHKK